MDNQQRSTSQEIYKQHPIYTRLEVSNFGNIRCFKTKRPRYTRQGKKGYIVLSYKVKGKPKQLKVHRLVAELHLPPPSMELVVKCKHEHYGKVIVKHLDNDKTNNHVSNLEWSDHKGNVEQAYSDNLIPFLKGEMNGRAKLTDSLVHEICKDYQEGMTPTQAIHKYGIPRQQATKIKAGFSWKHIWCQYDIKVNRRGKRSSTIRKE